MNAGYRHPVTRDLQWALGSPPLLAPDSRHCDWPGTGWFRTLAASAAPLLSALDTDPVALGRLPASGRAPRLGHYFERLWHYALGHHPRYRLLHHNLAVRENGRTIGEFDLILADQADGTVEHWELAVKFYLGFPPLHEPGRWIGPGGRELLDEKLARLTGHQTRLGLQPAAIRTLAGLGLRIDRCRAIIKGRLFYPLETGEAGLPAAHPDHLRGWWATPATFRRHFADRDLRWWPAGKSHWLAPWPAAAGPAGCHADELPDLVARLPGTHPKCVIGCNSSGEQQRGFLVPDGWPGGTVKT